MGFYDKILSPKSEYFKSDAINMKLAGLESLWNIFLE